MRQDLCDITIVLDRSGSMCSVRDDTIGGFNTFLSEQRKVPGAAQVTLTQFDDVYETVYAATPIGEAPPMTTDTFQPRGGTALLDAVGRTIVATGARLAKTPEADRPGKVVFVILTDGHENASHEYTRGMVFEQIKHQREVYGWQFVFLGANQDAIKAGASLGVAAASSMTYAANAVGTQAAFASTSRSLTSYRTGARQDTSYDAADRDAQTKAGAPD